MTVGTNKQGNSIGKIDNDLELANSIARFLDGSLETMFGLLSENDVDVEMGVFLNALVKFTGIAIIKCAPDGKEDETLVRFAEIFQDYCDKTRR